MVDPVTITALAKSIIDILRDIGSLAKKAGDHDLNSRVLELQGRLIELQTSVVELSEENTRLRREKSELELAKDTEGELHLEDGMYWRTRFGKRDGPFCGVCWGGGKGLIPLTLEVAEGNYRCFSCKGLFHTKNAKSMIAFAVLPPTRPDFR